MIKDGVNGLVPDEQNAKIVEASVTVQFEEDGSTRADAPDARNASSLTKTGSPLRTSSQGTRGPSSALGLHIGLPRAGGQGSARKAIPWGGEPVPLRPVGEAHPGCAAVTGLLGLPYRTRVLSRPELVLAEGSCGSRAIDLFGIGVT
jgi:hypothetical protein